MEAWTDIWGFGVRYLATQGHSCADSLSLWDHPKRFWDFHQALVLPIVTSSSCSPHQIRFWTCELALNLWRLAFCKQTPSLVQEKRKYEASSIKTDDLSAHRAIYPLIMRMVKCVAPKNECTRPPISDIHIGSSPSESKENLEHTESKIQSKGMPEPKGVPFSALVADLQGQISKYEIPDWLIRRLYSSYCNTSRFLSFYKKENLQAADSGLWRCVPMVLQ